jgi:hypothetical protein
VLLLLLNLSAAFDTVHHNLLLSKLRRHYGISSVVLTWFQSYLAERTFSVNINQEKSKRCYLSIGFPQRSILDPIFFILYTKELKIITKNMISTSICMQTICSFTLSSILYFKICPLLRRRQLAALRRYKTE